MSHTINILNEPEDFFNTLKRKINEAKECIILSALYIGNDILVKELIEIIHNRLTICPNLKVTFILDYSRSLRSQEEFISTFYSLMNNHSLNVKIYLYKMPQVSSFLSHNMNEILGVYHCKYYLFDDDVILSGANLNTEYFQNRQDRYVLFEQNGANSNNHNHSNSNRNGSSKNSKNANSNNHSNNNNSNNSNNHNSNFNNSSNNNNNNSNINDQNNSLQNKEHSSSSIDANKTIQENGTLSDNSSQSSDSSLIQWLIQFSSIITKFCYCYHIPLNSSTLPQTPPSFQDPAYREVGLLCLHLKPLLSTPMNHIYINNSLNNNTSIPNDDTVIITSMPLSSTNINATTHNSNRISNRITTPFQNISDSLTTTTTTTTTNATTTTDNATTITTKATTTPNNVTTITTNASTPNTSTTTNHPHSTISTDITSSSLSTSSTCIFTYAAPIIQHAVIGIRHESITLPRFIRNIVSLFTSSSSLESSSLSSSSLSSSSALSSSPLSSSSLSSSSSSSCNDARFVSNQAANCNTTNNNNATPTTPTPSTESMNTVTTVTNQPHLDFYVSSPYPSYSSTFLNSFLNSAYPFSMRPMGLENTNEIFIKNSCKNNSSKNNSNNTNTNKNELNFAVTTANATTTINFTTATTTTSTTTTTPTSVSYMPKITLSLFTPSSSAHGFTNSRGLKAVIPHLHQQAFLDSLHSLPVHHQALSYPVVGTTTSTIASASYATSSSLSQVDGGQHSDSSSSSSNNSSSNSSSSSSSSNNTIGGDSRSSVTVHEYNRPRWTYHAKGIWIFWKNDYTNSTNSNSRSNTNTKNSYANTINSSDSNNSNANSVSTKLFDTNTIKHTIRQLLDSSLVYTSSSTTSLPPLPFTAVSYIGSSNLGARSWKRDFELGFILFTNDDNVRQQLQAECNRMFTHNNNNNYGKSNNNSGCGTGDNFKVHTMNGININSSTACMTDISKYQSSSSSLFLSPSSSSSLSSFIQRNSFNQSSASYKVFIATATKLLRSYL